MPEKRQDPVHFSRTAEELIGELRGVPNAEPARQRKRPTTPLAQLVEDLMVKYQVGRASPEQAIRDAWPALVGPANAAYSHAVSIDPRGRLLVLASHGVVRQELTAHRRTIVGRIRELPGCGHVKELNVRAS